MLGLLLSWQCMHFMQGRTSSRRWSLILATSSALVIRVPAMRRRFSGQVCLIDMPGEYAENIDLAHAIALYIAEADVVGIVLSATEPYSLYPPNVASVSNRETIGIVTKIDHWCANPQQAAEWLRLTGCEHIFFTSSYTGEGIEEIHDFLKVEHEICTVDMVSSRIQEETFEKPAKLYDYHLL